VIPALAEARIGPNAITRVAEAGAARLGADAIAAIFAEAGLSHRLAAPPERMVPEAEVTRLHAALRARAGEAEAREVGRAAGRLTADYLLAHRVPTPMQWLLRRLPARLAARVLLGAVARHSWTFAGGAEFRVAPGNPTRVALRGCAICKGGARSEGMVCDFYGAALERLFRELVHPNARAEQTLCAARGDAECSFELRW